MIDVNYIREHNDEAIERLKMRTPEAESLIAEVLKVDDERKKFQQDRDSILSEAKKISEAMRAVFGDGKTTADLRDPEGKLSIVKTSEFGDAVVQALAQ